MQSGYLENSYGALDILETCQNIPNKCNILLVVPINRNNLGCIVRWWVVGVGQRRGGGHS